MERVLHTSILEPSLFAIAERFFHDHLGGMYEPLGDNVRGGIDVRVGAARVPGLPEALIRNTREMAIR